MKKRFNQFPRHVLYRKMILMETVRSGAVHENAIPILCLGWKVTGNHEGGKRMKRCEGGWIARSKQAVKLPFKY